MATGLLESMDYKGGGLLERAFSDANKKSLRDGNAPFKTLFPPPPPPFFLGESTPYSVGQVHDPLVVKS